MLYCVECGCCSGELGKGWVAFRCDDPECDDRPEVAIWCPVCAAAELATGLTGLLVGPDEPRSLCVASSVHISNH